MSCSLVPELDEAAALAVKHYEDGHPELAKPLAESIVLIAAFADDETGIDEHTDRIMRVLDVRVPGQADRSRIRSAMECAAGADRFTALTWELRNYT